ncbi:MAG: carboxysome peptide B [Gammaproteobacteria bacterium]|jgi:carboxysome peptide B|nr:carboxysome peptide B [Gammaproteobacteria bacterium]
MQILQVEGSLVCTSRIEGMKHSVFRIVRDANGKRQVATDPVGAKPGNWVFLASGSAARFAAGDFEILTDLTIAGIIDEWPPEDTNGAAS